MKTSSVSSAITELCLLDPVAKPQSTQMKRAFRSSRDVIVQTDNWTKTIEFYETTMGFAVSHRSSILMGFETGAFCLYVEKGNRPGPVFDFLVADTQTAKSQLLAAGCPLPTTPHILTRWLRNVRMIRSANDQSIKKKKNRPHLEMRSVCLPPHLCRVLSLSC